MAFPEPKRTSLSDLQDRLYSLEQIVTSLLSKKEFSIDSPKPVKAAQIIDAVAEWEGVPVKHIRGPSRIRKIARARFIAIYIIRETTGMSLQDISMQFSYKDHGSVLHAIRQTEEEMTVDASLKSAINGYIKKLKTPPQP